MAYIFTLPLRADGTLPVRVVEVLDSGALDAELARIVPVTSAVPRKRRMFADLPVFDDEKWEARRSPGD